MGGSIVSAGKESNRETKATAFLVLWIIWSGEGVRVLRGCPGVCTVVEESRRQGVVVEAEAEVEREREDEGGQRGRMQPLCAAGGCNGQVTASWPVGNGVPVRYRSSPCWIKCSGTCA